MPTYVVELMDTSSPEPRYEEVEADSEHQARMLVRAKYSPPHVEINEAWLKDIDQPG